MQLQTFIQSILVNIFPIGLLRLSASTYEATASTAAAVVSHLERFCHTSVRFGNIRKVFLPCLRGKRITIILHFLAEENQNCCKKIQKKKCPNCFTVVSL